MKTFIKRITHFLSLIVKKVGLFWGFVFSKISSFLSRHFLRLEGQHLIIFNKFKKKTTLKSRKAIFGYLFIILWIIGFLWMTLYPMLMSFIYSTSTVSVPADGPIQITSVGFNNYINIFTTEFEFITSLTDFIIETVVSLPIIIVISLLLAILLNQKIKGKGFFRAIFFLPAIIVSGPVLNEFTGANATSIPLLNDSGIVETINASLPLVFARPLANLFGRLIIMFWFSGVQIVLFLAGLQKTNAEIYEAAQIDGASPWESFWKITLPSLKGVIAISGVYTVCLLATISINPILGHIKDSMFGKDVALGGYGYASAMAWIYSLLVLILIAITALIIIRPKKEAKDTYKRRVGM